MWLLVQISQALSFPRGNFSPHFHVRAWLYLMLKPHASLVCNCYAVVATNKISEMLSCLLIFDRFSWSILMSVLTKSQPWMG